LINYMINLVLELENTLYPLGILSEQ